MSADSCSRNADDPVVVDNEEEKDNEEETDKRLVVVKGETTLLGNKT